MVKGNGEKSLYLADVQIIGQRKGEMTRIKVFAADLDQAYKGASAFGLVLAVYDADENLLV